MKEAPGSSETSVLTRATRRNNPEDTILDRIIVSLPSPDDGNRLNFLLALFSSYSEFPTRHKFQKKNDS
jgi:hypothetical protein